jgi:hypothetical protein
MKTSPLRMQHFIDYCYGSIYETQTLGGRIHFERYGSTVHDCDRALLAGRRQNDFTENAGTAGWFRRHDYTVEPRFNRWRTQFRDLGCHFLCGERALRATQMLVAKFQSDNHYLPVVTIA